MKGVWVVMACTLSSACASDGTRRGPSRGLDDSNGVGERRDAGKVTSSTNDNDSADALAGSSAAGDAAVAMDAPTPTLSDGDTSGPNSFHDYDAWTPPDATDAGSSIIQPTDDPIDVVTLCAGAWELQGRVVRIDLLGQVTPAEWRVVDVPTGEHAGARDASAPMDADACVDKFAPYVVACTHGVMLVHSPSMVYGTGPIVGGENVSMGCWQHECNSACLPAALEDVGVVRVSMSPIVANTSQEGGPAKTGWVRVNGVELEVLATLEVTRGAP